MDKVLKKDSSKCITPSSEPFRIDLRLPCFVVRPPLWSGG
jgi:hypothetical protein